MKRQALFWFVHAHNNHGSVSLAVAAYTKLQARRQARKRIGDGYTITDVLAIDYAQPWVVNHRWTATA